MDRPIRATLSIHRIWFGYSGRIWAKWLRRGGRRKPYLILWTWGTVDWTDKRDPRCEVTGSHGMRIPSDHGKTGDADWWEKPPVSLAKMPHLARLLFSRRYSGTKQERDPGTISVKWLSGGLQVTLRDPTAKVCIRAEITGWDALWLECEALLSMETPPWERDEFAKPKIKMGRANPS